MATNAGTSVHPQGSTQGKNQPQLEVHDDGSLPELDSIIQDGVKKIEAITATWSYKALILTYVLIYISSYTHSMQQQLVRNLQPYVTSSFSRHGLTPTVGIVASLAGGVSQFPLAKILNVFGRMECYIIVHILCTVGLILMAVARSVETYAAALVFWTIGSGGIGYVHTILIADTTSLRNRMIIYTINSTAYIGNSFAGPVVASLFYHYSDFRWAFGSFAIIFPVISSPICIMLWYHLRKAKKIGKGPELSTSSSRNLQQSIFFYLNEFDIIGIFLLIAGFSLFLLPFNIVAYSPYGWKTGYIIAMIILGVFLVVTFGIWERKFAALPFLPWENLQNRTTLGAAGMAAILFLSFSSWDSYFSSYLQVVHQQTIQNAGYIINIYTVASCTWGPFVGFLIRQTNHYKWIALSAVPVACLATALLIHFRHPYTEIGYIIMCQIFKAVSGGTLIICEQLAVMAVVAHNQLAPMLALIGLASSIGGSIGDAISGGIWTNQLPSYLAATLPEEVKANATEIYGSLAVQLTYAWGTPTRDAIVYSYGEVQRKMVIAGASFIPLALICVLFWKNVNVKNTKQTAGQIF